MKPRAARALANQASDSAVPPVPCDNRMSGNFAGALGMLAFCATLPRTKKLRPGICNGCSAAEAAAGYQIVVGSAWVFAPRQLYGSFGTKLRKAMPALKPPAG